LNKKLEILLPYKDQIYLERLLSRMEIRLLASF